MTKELYAKELLAKLLTKEELCLIETVHNESLTDEEKLKQLLKKV